MENIDNTNTVDDAAPAPLTPEQAAKILQDAFGSEVAITTDEAEPTDADRVLN